MTENRINYRLTVAYDGIGFMGWQRHGDQATVQLALERALGAVFGVDVRVAGSGRTDRGAHANGQVASARLPAITTDLDLVVTEVNAALPQAVKIRDLREVGDEFHARDSAVAKHYRYLIWTEASLPAEREGRVWHVRRPLKLAPMQAACAVFVGRHDFASFAKKPNFERASTTRTVSHAELWRDGPLLVFDIHADGFLYKMVRNIVRALAKVGEGRLDADGLGRILAARDRKAAPGTAPASGLYLERVFYAGDEP